MSTATYGTGRNAFSLAAGSPGELGLVAALAEAFCRRADARAAWTKAGTGESLRLLREGQVDMALVHAPGMAERAAVEGWAAAPIPFAANRYCLLGPVADPANVGSAADAVDAFRRIAESGQPFVSRGDDSGTHHKELELWRAAGASPQGDAYIVARDFMTACLLRANAARAYFLCDSSTWIMERAIAPRLAVLFDGDPTFVNHYHALVAPGCGTAADFARFLAADGQAILRDYGRAQFGAALYEGLASRTALMDELLSRPAAADFRDDPLRPLLASMLAGRALGEGIMPATLGLAPDEFAALWQAYFPGSHLRLEDGRTEDIPEMDDLVRLFDDYRAGPDARYGWMTRILAVGCAGRDHLWQDMAFVNRGELSAFMAAAFPALAALNTGDMKWKKFIYRHYCQRDGIYVCPAPSCGECIDYAKCFAPED